MHSAGSELRVALEQLFERRDTMARLGSEGDEVKLDWVEGVARLLHDRVGLTGVESEAREIVERGIRHVIWAGMGGSVMAVRVLVEMGFGSGSDGIAVHPLDSTDPAALNRIVEEIARAKGLSLRGRISPSFLHRLLDDVMMVGVAMGMTSEEPITHLEWFADLLHEADLAPAEHLLVMALPDSYLDRFAREHGVTIRSLQLDAGTGTGGRMSAPTTRVFLLPVALWMAGRFPPGSLHDVLHRAWSSHDLAGAVEMPESHPYVRLAVALHAASEAGRCRLLIQLPPALYPLLPWIEQLMEESLGKAGKGVVVFDHQSLRRDAPAYRTTGTLRVAIASDEREVDADYTLLQPDLFSPDPLHRLGAIAGSFLGWQLAMALYGYLNGITFAGQPAVETYKSRARSLRDTGRPLAALEGQTILFDRLEMAVPSGLDLSDDAQPAQVFATVLLQAASTRLDYLDITLNGEPSADWESVYRLMRAIANRLLGVPIKMRRAPAAYHSTEQSEMDGPADLVSLRLLTRLHERSMLGDYTDLFLQAQAVATWQAMVEVGRTCFLLLVDGDGVGDVVQFLQEVEMGLQRGLPAA